MNHRLDDTEPRSIEAEDEPGDSADREEPRANVITLIAYFVTAVLATGVLLAAFIAIFAGCGAPASTVKSHLKTADSYVQLACMGLAQAVAARTGADAAKIIAATCDVENVTRTMREVLLSQQLDAARSQGVLVPDINSGALEDAQPPEEQNAE